MISTEPKTGSVPIDAAVAPITGPSRAPAMAVPSAVPITLPRLSSGELVISQVSAPAQIRAPAIPWMKRAESSKTIWLTKPKARLETPSSSRPADDAAPRTDPAGEETGRQRGDQGAGGVGRREDPGFGLAEPQLVDVVRQQRRHGGKESDVEEDHRRGQ
jgi:hypothetical protein